MHRSSYLSPLQVDRIKLLNWTISASKSITQTIYGDSLWELKGKYGSVEPKKKEAHDHEIEHSWDHLFGGSPLLMIMR